MPKIAGNPTWGQELNSQTEAPNQAQGGSRSVRDYQGMAMVIRGIDDYRKFAALVVLITDIGLFFLAGVVDGYARYLAIGCGAAILVLLIGTTLFLEIRDKDSVRFCESLGSRAFGAIAPYLNLDRESFTEAMEVFKADMSSEMEDFSPQQRRYQKVFVISFIRQSKSFKLVKKND